MLLEDPPAELFVLHLPENPPSRLLQSQVKAANTAKQAAYASLAPYGIT